MSEARHENGFPNRQVILKVSHVLSRFAGMSEPQSVAIRPGVIIVDDDIAIRRAVKATLEPEGYDVETCATAEEVLPLLTRTRPACIILDIRLPGMSGTELYNRLLDMRNEIPVVFLSAAADIPTAILLMKRGASDLLEKPCDLTALKQTVREAVDTHHLRRERQLQIQEVERRAATLTPREKDVAEMMAKGFRNKEIGNALGVSERTIEVHRARVLNKMGIDTIATFALRWTMAFAKE